MGNFVRQRINCNSFDQHYKSKISVFIFKILSKEIDINGNKCEILDKCFGFVNKYEKMYAKEFESKYDDYRDINQKEKTDFNNNKHNMLANHKQMSKIDLNVIQLASDATSLYPSAMWDKNSV